MSSCDDVARAKASQEAIAGLPAEDAASEMADDDTKVAAKLLGPQFSRLSTGVSIDIALKRGFFTWFIINDAFSPCLLISCDLSSSHGELLARVVDAGSHGTVGVPLPCPG